MGRASSSKKVARAAGTGGGRTSGRRTPWGYYGVIALVVLLGVTGTWISRDRRSQQVAAQGSGQPAVGGTPWNEAFAVFICGKFVPNIAVTTDPAGIRSQDDGIIHISPKTKSVSGKNATLGVYTTAVGMTLTPAVLKVPGGKTYQDGDLCEGAKGHVYVKQFAYAGAPTGTLSNGDPQNVLLADQQELVVAFVPSSRSATIPGPPAAVVAALKKLAAPSTSTTATTVAPASPTATTPTTLAPGVATPTTATPAATTPTTATPAATTPATATPAPTTPTTAAPVATTPTTVARTSSST